MGKDKLRRFAENLTFECLVQPRFADEVFGRDHALVKGAGTAIFFHNDRPIVLSNWGAARASIRGGAGRAHAGAQLHRHRHQGRLHVWRGAKTATERGMGNVGFLRTRIELIGSFSPRARWTRSRITFPDPQLRTKRARSLTAPGFLAAYARMLAPGGTIHLKTDSKHLYAYTQAVIARFGLPCAEATDDLYGSGRADDVLSVRTAYEQAFPGDGTADHLHPVRAGRPHGVRSLRVGGRRRGGRRTTKRSARPVAACGCGTELVRRRRAAGGAAAGNRARARNNCRPNDGRDDTDRRTVHAPGARRGAQGPRGGRGAYRRRGDGRRGG